ncbi:MAG: CRISPR-associated protein Cas4 [Mollicutes bacterium]|nr:CRISPR-associated protein Cas4 [Mollicutes bacterium]
MNSKITGVDIYYYKVCTRKLWYFHHEIQMEQDNENVKIGKALDEESYSRENKHINIDNVINIDFIKSTKVIHEIKKSKKIEEASILQVKYYLYYLISKGVYGIKGKIDYPLLKQSLNVEINEEDFIEIEKILGEINCIINKNIPPKLEKKKICRNCAYYDLCYI